MFDYLKPLEYPQSSNQPGHVNHNTLPWVMLAPGVEIKILRVCEDTGSWVTLNRFAPGVRALTHRHNGSLIAYTIKGKWGYVEHDFLATPGSVVREPACSTHTLVVPQDSDESAEVIFIVEGSLINIGPDGSIWGVADAQTELANYLHLAEMQNKTVDKNLILK